MSSSSDDNKECPLCMEPLELDDIIFYPCECLYQICQFCWHRIRTDENGLCPACRQPYKEDPAEFKPADVDKVVHMKRERKNRDQQKKQKAAENRKHLANLRVIQKSLVFVVGLSPRLSDPNTLKRDEYFGRFGRIVKVVINSSTTYAGAQRQTQGPTASAYITYAKSEDCLRAIQTVNSMVVDGRTIKASLGTTKYCSMFLKGLHCPKQDCMYLHERADGLASFTKEDMAAGKHQEYEQALIDQYNTSPSTSNSTPLISSANPPGTTPASSSLAGSTQSGGDGGCQRPSPQPTPSTHPNPVHCLSSSLPNTVVPLESLDPTPSEMVARTGIPRTNGLSQKSRRYDGLSSSQPNGLSSGISGIVPLLNLDLSRVAAGATGTRGSSENSSSSVSPTLRSQVYEDAFDSPLPLMDTKPRALLPTPGQPPTPPLPTSAQRHPPHRKTHRSGGSGPGSVSSRSNDSPKLPDSPAPGSRQHHSSGAASGDRATTAKNPLSALDDFGTEIATPTKSEPGLQLNNNNGNSFCTISAPPLESLETHLREEQNNTFTNRGEAFSVCNEDDLGFDPFAESMQGLVDLMEKEDLGEDQPGMRPNSMHELGGSLGRSMLPMFPAPQLMGAPGLGAPGLGAPGLGAPLQCARSQLPLSNPLHRSVPPPGFDNLVPPQILPHHQMAPFGLEPQGNVQPQSRVLRMMNQQQLGLASSSSSPSLFYSDPSILFSSTTNQPPTTSHIPAHTLPPPHALTTPAGLPPSVGIDGRMGNVFPSSLGANNSMSDSSNPMSLFQSLSGRHAPTSAAGGSALPAGLGIPQQHTTTSHNSYEEGLKALLPNVSINFGHSGDSAGSGSQLGDNKSTSDTLPDHPNRYFDHDWLTQPQPTATSAAAGPALLDDWVDPAIVATSDTMGRRRVGMPSLVGPPPPSTSSHSLSAVPNEQPSHPYSSWSLPYGDSFSGLTGAGAHNPYTGLGGGNYCPSLGGDNSYAGIGGGNSSTSDSSSALAALFGGVGGGLGGSGGLTNGHGLPPHSLLARSRQASAANGIGESSRAVPPTASQLKQFAQGITSVQTPPPGFETQHN